MNALIFAIVFAAIFAVRDGLVNRHIDIYRPYLKDIPEDKLKYAQRISDFWHLLGYTRNFILIVLWVLLAGFNWKEVFMILATFMLISDDIVSMVRGTGFETKCSIDSVYDVNDWLFETIRKAGIHPFIVKAVLFVSSIFIDVIYDFIIKSFSSLKSIIIGVL